MPRFENLPERLRHAKDQVLFGNLSALGKACLCGLLEDAALKIEAIERDREAPKQDT